jgi:hypothetical protein
LQKVHTEYNQDAEDLQKCIHFFEQQLMMFADDVDIDRPIPIPGELESFEQIKNRRAIHEKDDQLNFTGKDAIQHSMNQREKQLIQAILMHNRMNKNAKIWKFDRINLGKIIKEVVDKHEANGGGPANS